ncbi:type II toxin-antitoxin system VapB family antitoxin [Mesorhizobium sp. NBSH29]|uniref:type II toxin-antitoxin system VapB family antitoxin n=1 Tax=Mesorhizobium sp. NBSH29 TaxID=2654249 RepID=UPI00189685D4|nr:type II toxin-antitoxin system VapB family antitoxin [Mesorhizobium sp. NBSH29]
MNIKNAAVEKLAREVAATTGETMTAAIQTALEERLERLHKQRDVAERKRQLRKILARLPAPPAGMTSDHGFLYDEFGLPK